MRRGFSLVELSIVLVILGLLVGGILAGRSLIRASEVRSVATDIDKYRASIFAFRDKYFGWPGDITNATSIWGRDNTLCSGHGGTLATPGTCNGNGNSLWDAWGPETYRAWQHLTLAGIVEGNYVGTVTSYLTPTVAGVDIPPSKVGSGAGWSLSYMSQLGTVHGELGFSDLPDVRRNTLILGWTKTNYWANGPALTPEEAWNIDTKIDDGMPAFGKLRGGTATSCGTNAASVATYRLDATGLRCQIGYILE